MEQFTHVTSVMQQILVVQVTGVRVISGPWAQTWTMQKHGITQVLIWTKQR